jgi:hypothetical protein
MDWIDHEPLAALAWRDSGTPPLISAAAAGLMMGDDDNILLTLEDALQDAGARRNC